MTGGKAQTARFPGLFVSGQDAISQAQAIDYARMSGWALRSGQNASMIASRDEREVVLPASGVQYSVEDSAKVVAALKPYPHVPPARGRPGSPEFAEVLHRYHLTGLPAVGVGRRWGPQVPQIREPTEEAPDLLAIDRDMEAVAKQRWHWAQPWHPGSVTAENRDDVLRRTALWTPETKRGTKATKWRPCSHLAICMWASSSRHLHGQHDDHIADLIEAKDPRTVHRAIGIGNQTWACLGGWPWATRDEGALDASWWESDDVWDALAAAIDRRLRRAQALASALKPPSHGTLRDCE